MFCRGKQVPFCKQKLIEEHVEEQEIMLDALGQGYIIAYIFS